MMQITIVTIWISRLLAIWLSLGFLTTQIMGQTPVAKDTGYSLPPVTAWRPSQVVDEPVSAFHSLGRTMWHLGRNHTKIQEFHAWLKRRKIKPVGLLAKGLQPPADLRHILIEPERVPNNGWKIAKEWISSAPGHRGPEARIPLTIDRAGIYRVWIRYQGHAKGTAVTHLTVFRKGKESEAPLLYEEFDTLPAGQDGPRWHDLMTDLDAGEYTLVLGHVVRYYHTPTATPFAEHKVDCLFLTDELWAEAPTDEQLIELRGMSDSAQNTARPKLSATQTWLTWQVRPSHWETACENEALFRLSYAFWQDEIQSITKQNYAAAPLDSVHKGIADYRDPRRQVVFDPIWNMVANPYRIQKQKAILESDIDTSPTAKDAVFDWIYPGHFPVVTGQWIREGGGLSADHAATNALALGRYTVARPGKWHLWVQFHNINYFEYYAIHANTMMGQRASWERIERLYPGGHPAWAKIGELDIPSLTPAETQAHQNLADQGIFVNDGKIQFANQFGEWKQDGKALVSTAPNSLLWASSALNADEEFRISARLSITEKPMAGVGFFMRDRLGLRDNVIDFDGAIAGPAFEKGTTSQLATHIREKEPFDLEIERKGESLSWKINDTVAGSTKLADLPSGRFGFRAGKNTLHIHSFSAKGKLDDGLDMRRNIDIALKIDKYINPRTYRGVYRLFITDDAEYKPQGNLLPTPSLARFESQMKAAGGTQETGYVMNLARGINSIHQAWMPGPEPTQPKLDLAMVRDSTSSGSLYFRNVRNEPIVLNIAADPLVVAGKKHTGHIQWRAVGFAPYGEGREAWTPYFLLRRPFLIIPPRGVAQAWLTFDSTGLPPGAHSSAIRISATDLSGKNTFPSRTVAANLSVADLRIEPEKPILIHGWTNPPPGEEYRRDWFQRFNVWQGPFFSKADMVKYGLKQQIWCQRHVNEQQIRQIVEQAQKAGLAYDDWMMSVMDEPTGQTAAELKDYLTIGKMIRSVDPKVVITMNPGEAARAPTFQILQPYVDLWNPYRLHLSYGPSGKDYLKKPWIWYTTPCYQDKSPGIAREMYDQIRSVLRQPGDCRGTAFFAPYYPWRDPWDTAYEHIKDVSAFVLPSRHGPVGTPAWEAIRDSVQHANLARMVRERAQPDDAAAKALWENGSIESLRDWLLKQNSR